MEHEGGRQAALVPFTRPPPRRDGVKSIRDVIAIQDGVGTVVFERRLRNWHPDILAALAPHRAGLAEVTREMLGSGNRCCLGLDRTHGRAATFHDHVGHNLDPESARGGAE